MSRVTFVVCHVSI